MNEIDETVWKKDLQKREKAREKARDISNILTMYTNTGGDYLRQMIVKQVTKEETVEFFGELTKYFNETMENIHKRYNCVTPYIIPANYNVIHFSFKGEPRQ
jgi:myosin-crossreactive antigen